MTISNEEMEQLINEYQIYANKIVNRSYFFLDSVHKDELYHIGLIGLWKGISAYYQNNPDSFERKEFVNTICTYIRYEIASFFRKSNLIRMSSKQWRNYIKANQLASANPDADEKQLESLITNAGLRYDWYLKANKMIAPLSLDMPVSKDNSNDIYEFLLHNDDAISHFENQSYIDYIITSAMHAVKTNRDKALISTWLKSISDGKELKHTELGNMYQLTSGMVAIIINRFVDVCRFIRNCEYEFIKDSNGTIYFPEIAEKNKTYNGKKIPGVKWVISNRKWKVEISIGKNKSVYIGQFEKYEDAVKARSEAEIKYRGYSNINI